MRARLRRGDIARTLAVRLSVSVRFADRITRELFGVLADELSAGRDVDIRGFGRFEVRTWPARDNHLLGGGTKRLPERRYVKFRTGETLKRRVRCNGAQHDAT